MWHNDGMTEATTAIVTDLISKVGTIQCPPHGRVTVTAEGFSANGTIVCFSSAHVVMVRLDGTDESVHIPTSLVTKETS